MTRWAGLLAISLVLAAGGCGPGTASSLWPHAPLGTVPDTHALAPTPTGPMPSLKSAPPTEAVARRVNEVAQRLLAANADLPLRPIFMAIGSPEPEIFHRDTSAVFVSEGLANRCTTDAQLAAVLSNELGKMVSTREALLVLRSRRSEREPPVSLPIGGDSGGTFGPADGTRLAELGKFEQSTGRGPAGGPPPTPPDPQLLARTYLKRAGFTPADLDAVAPLLSEAQKHSDLELQINAGPIRPFVGP
jgi:hypothetical protein